MKESKMQAYTSEYCMSGGDNAAAREEINRSIISNSVTNEGEYRKAMQEDIDKIGENAPNN